SRLTQTKVEGRTRGDVIRLETSCAPGDELAAFIRGHLEVRKSASFVVPDHFDYKFLFSLSDYFDYETLADLRFPAARPVIPPQLAKTSDLISEVKRKDIFLAYPYQSMDVLIKLLNQAADDERVTSIKITIYRLAKNSKIISALLRARENGKEVVAVMELCARFDEENNLDNAEVLQDAGCTVFYGIDDYKVHSKIISITLEEDGNISYITHIGTGNYNEGTAKQYTDLNIITADDGIGRDGADFFRNLAVLNLEHEYSRLLVAPHTLKSGLIAEIDREIAKGKDGVIRAKFNSLTDLDCINKLVEAGKAGVKVSLVVRGICCLLPGVPGETENITVLSIVGRFLEHSRIYSFGREGEERVYIASADMMTRNLEKRVEIAVPVLDKNVKKRILSILTTIENDNVKGRRLSPDGRYRKIQSLSKMVNSQEECLRAANTL
ncbi:MAG: polyphosphate kinase 1, partial [Bullifex sp.]